MSARTARILVVFSAASLIVACDDSSTGVGTPVDAEMDGGVADDGGTGETDAGESPDMGEEPMPDMGMEEVPDQGPPMAFDGSPDYAQAAAASSEGRTYVAWSGPDAVHWGVLDGDGSFILGDAPLADAPAAQVAALTVDGVPWIAYTGPDGIVLRQGDLLPGGPTVQTDLGGDAVALADAGDRVMVVGAVDDMLSWQLVDEAGETSPVTRDDAGLGFPDSAAGQRNGVVFRFDEEGQCLFLSLAGVAAGSFPCLIGKAALLSDGDRILLSRTVFDEDDDRDLVRVSDLWQTEEEGFAVTSVVIETLLDFPVVDGVRPVVGRSIAGDSAGRLDLNLAGTEMLWASSESWEEEWPWPDARLIVQRDETAWLFRFQDAERPAITEVGLGERAMEGQPYGIEFDPECAPTVETCDDADRDCDGRAANGLCCGNAAAQVTLPLAGAPLGMRVAEIQNNDVYTVAIQTAAEGEVARTWDAYWVRLLTDPITVSPIDEVQHSPPMERPNVRPFAPAMQFTDEEGDVHYADDALAMVQSGGLVMMLAADQEGTLYSWWYNTWRDYPDDRPEGSIPCDERDDSSIPQHICMSPPREIPCAPEDVLAFDIVDQSDQFSAISVLIACRDKLVRNYYRLDRPNEEIAYPDLPTDPEWVTITRGGPRVSRVLAGYGTDEGVALQPYLFLSALGSEPQPDGIPRALRDLTGDDEPTETGRIWLHPVISLPPVEVDPQSATARVRLRTGGGFVWQEVVTPGETIGVKYAPERQQLVTVAQIDDQIGFWIVGINAPSDLNLWSTEPAVTVPADQIVRDEEGELMWGVPLGDVPWSVYYLEQDPESEEYRFSMHTIGCTAL